MKQIKFNIYWLYMLIGIALMSIWFMQDDAVSKDVSWTEFQSYVEKDGVKSIIVYSDKRMAEGVLTDSMTNVVFGANNRPLSEKIGRAHV